MCFAEQNVAHSVDIVDHLLQHYGQAVHAEDAPGGKREGALELDFRLAAQMRVVGREQTYECTVAMLARIYKRWQRRSPLSDTLGFRRGLAHLLLLSSPGTGGISH